MPTRRDTLGLVVGQLKAAFSQKRPCMRYVIALLLLTSTALARDNGYWSGQSANNRQWFQSLMQPDNPHMSCCGEADAFEADSFDQENGHWVAIITDGKGVLANGTRFVIPDGKVKWDNGNPTGHGIIFIGDEGQVFCYVVPGGT